MGIWGRGGDTGFEGYDYVRSTEPDQPDEGTTWYDIDADHAFVYTGAEWTEMTVTDHGQLSGVTSDAHHAKTTDHSELGGVSSDAHHTRYTDSEAIQATDGVIDAETVDGQHASDLTPPNSTQTTSEAVPVATLSGGYNGGQSSPVGASADRIEWSLSDGGSDYGTEMEIVARYGDGTADSQTVTTSGSGDSAYGTLYLNEGKFLNRVTINDVDSAAYLDGDTTAYGYLVHSHSHNI